MVQDHAASASACGCSSAMAATSSGCSASSSVTTSCASCCGASAQKMAGIQPVPSAIRRDDFPWPEGYHAESLFAEKVGPVCRPDKVATWFSTKKASAALKTGAPRLHSRTRPGAWSEWAVAAGQPVQDAAGQTFEHFYFSLQAAVAGLGVAIGPWHLVRDDLDSGVLTPAAPAATLFACLASGART